MSDEATPEDTRSVDQPPVEAAEVTAGETVLDTDQREAGPKPDADVRVRVPGTEATIAADEAVAAQSASASDDEPTFENPLRPTAEERAKWEAWRDAKDRARSDALEAEVANQGFPTPDPQTEIRAAREASGVDTFNPGASRTMRTEAVKAADGEQHVSDADVKSPSE